MQPCRRSGERWGVAGRSARLGLSRPTRRPRSWLWGSPQRHRVLLICFGVLLESFFEKKKRKRDGCRNFTLFKGVNHTNGRPPNLHPRWLSAVACFPPPTGCPPPFPLPLRLLLSVRPSFALRSLCHREHKLFSHRPQRLNDWCVQTTHVGAGMTCSPDPSPSPVSAALHTPDMSVLASIPPLTHHPSSLTCDFFFLHEVGLHKPLPWESRASSLFCTPETQLTGN